MNSESSSYKQILNALKAVVIVPTYNNQGTLTAVLDALLEYTNHIIVVNDGSTDQTPILLDKYQSQLEIITYKPNKGKGYALKKGFERALEKGYKYAITIDSDGQHYAKDIALFAKEIEKHPNALIVGSRILKQKNMKSGSTFANKFSNFWFQLQTGTALPDTQSGFRAYPLHLMGRMKIFTYRYEAELELLVFSAWRGIEMRALPISVYYPPIEEKVSHFRPFQDFFRISLLNSVLVFLAIIYGYPALAIHKLVKIKSTKA